MVPAELATALLQSAGQSEQPVAAVQGDASQRSQPAPFDRAWPPASAAHQSMEPGQEQQPPIPAQSVAARLEDQEAAYWPRSTSFRHLPHGRLKP